MLENKVFICKVFANFFLYLIKITVKIPSNQEENISCLTDHLFFLDRSNYVVITFVPLICYLVLGVCHIMTTISITHMVDYANQIVQKLLTPPRNIILHI